MLKNNIYLLFLFMGLFVFSCKKDRLKGDSEILVGKWRWVKTIKSLDQPQIVYADPITDGINYEIEFFKCGKLKYLKNKNEVFDYKLKFDGNYLCDDNWCNFPILLNKTTFVKAIIYNATRDTLYITDYPYDEFIDGNGNTDNYRNVYVRE